MNGAQKHDFELLTSYCGTPVYYTHTVSTDSDIRRAFKKICRLPNFLNCLTCCIECKTKLHTFQSFLSVVIFMTYARYLGGEPRANFIFISNFGKDT